MKDAAPQSKEYPTVRDPLYGGLKSWKQVKAAQYAQKTAAGQCNETADVGVLLRACWLYIDGEEEALKNVNSESTVQHRHATEILNAIIDHFHQHLTIRQAIVTSAQHTKNASNVGHWEYGARGRLRFPTDCIIVGCGGAVSPSRTLPSGEAIQCTACVTPVQLRLDKAPSDDHAVQVGVFSREVLRLCHDHEHVYGLLRTRNCVPLILYDRNGVMRSAKVDIHKDPATVIGIVTGVSSPEDTKIGYAECLERRNCVRPRRLPRLCDVSKLEDDKPLELQNAVLITLPYNNQIQPFIRNSMHIRSSTYWHVQDAAASTLVAKFAWRFADRTPEWDTLRDAKGPVGAAQLYALCDGITNISQDRSCVAGDTDRVLSHTLMDGYRGRVEDFSSTKQLLCAIHDAVEGHMNLFLGCGLLHRDVSTRNVFLGNSDRAVCRGAIIDWDLSSPVNQGAKASPFFRKGTRAFQSARVLKGKPHDYWDDLESFFYVCTWTLATSKLSSIGQAESSDLRKEFTKWYDADDLHAVNAKLAFLLWPSTSQPFLSETAAWDSLHLIDMLKDVIKFYAFVKEMEEAEFARKQGGRTIEYVRTVKRADIMKEYNMFLQPIRNEIRRLDLGLPPPSPFFSNGII